MKMQTLAATLLLATSAVALAPAAHAQSVDPCNVFTCMAGISGFGTSGGPACTPDTEFFFGTLAVYDEEGFDAPASAALRYMYLSYCPGTDFSTNSAVKSAIVDVWFGTP